MQYRPKPPEKDLMNSSMDLKTIIEQSDTKPGRYFDIFVQLLIVVSIITFSIDTLPDLDSSTQFALKITETLIVILFTLEYLLRIYVADKKLAYIFSFYGIISLCDFKGANGR